MLVHLCIFWGTPLDRTTKPEHILHDALGGRKTTRRVVCSGCNNRFGGSIDKVLAEQFGAVRTLLKLRSGTGALPPMLKRVTAGREGGLNPDRVRRAGQRPWCGTEPMRGRRSAFLTLRIGSPGLMVAPRLERGGLSR
jgi:hypothetical protein